MKKWARAFLGLPFINNDTQQLQLFWKMNDGRKTSEKWVFGLTFTNFLFKLCHLGSHLLFILCCYLLTLSPCSAGCRFGMCWTEAGSVPQEPSPCPTFGWSWYRSKHLGDLQVSSSPSHNWILKASGTTLDHWCISRECGRIWQLPYGSWCHCLYRIVSIFQV